jgi:hypothetical protein
MERFLYRLSVSPHSDQFILKGALMLFVWCPEPSRQTMDIDLLGRVPNDLDLIGTVFRAICTQDVPSDGMVFDQSTVEVERITREAAFEGVRAKLRGGLGNTRELIRVDIGFGDRVVPQPEILDYPTLLDFPAPRLRAYRRETAIAEKLQAMVQLGDLNSRMKDFLDVWSLSRCFDFDGQVLAEAIGATFDQRSQQVPSSPLALTAEFARSPSKQQQWSSFLRKRGFRCPLTSLRSLSRSRHSSSRLPVPSLPGFPSALTGTHQDLGYQIDRHLRPHWKLPGERWNVHGVPRGDPAGGASARGLIRLPG